MIFLCTRWTAAGSPPGALLASPRVTPVPNARRYTIGSVVSRDGTTIAYRQFRKGPGIIAERSS